MIFKSRKKNKLIAFCTNENLAKIYPPRPAQKPKWIQELPGLQSTDKNWGGHQDKIPTIRHCPAIDYLYKNSWQIPLWTDYSIAVSLPNKVQVKGYSQADSHHEKQYEGGFRGWVNCKLISPWVFVDQTAPRPWMWQEDTYCIQYPSQFRVLPAQTEFYHQHFTNINLMLPLPKHEGAVWETNLSNGDSLVLLTPLIEGDWDIKIEVVTEQEINKYQRWNYQQIGNYQRIVQRWELNKYGG